MGKWPLKDQHRYTGYTAGTNRKLKSVAGGGDIESARVPIVPMIGGGRVPGMTVIRTSARLLLAVRAESESDIGASVVYSIRPPKISHAEIKMRSSPP
jgi:hypothetical protein